LLETKKTWPVESCHVFVLAKLKSLLGLVLTLFLNYNTGWITLH